MIRILALRRFQLFAVSEAIANLPDRACRDECNLLQQPLFNPRRLHVLLPNTAHIDRSTMLIAASPVRTRDQAHHG